MVCSGSKFFLQMIRLIWIYLHIAKRTARFGSFANDLDSPDELACCKEGGAQQHFFDKNVLRKPLTIDRPIVIVRLIDDGQHQSIF